MTQRTDKAEKMFDALMDYMLDRLKDEEPMHPSELKVIQSFLSEQGMSCLGENNEKVKGLSASLPVNVTKLQKANK